jgi:hypothetical protein
MEPHSVHEPVGEYGKPRQVTDVLKQSKDKIEGDDVGQHHRDRHKQTG